MPDTSEKNLMKEATSRMNKKLANTRKAIKKSIQIKRELRQQLPFLGPAQSPYREDKADLFVLQQPGGYRPTSCRKPVFIARLRYWPEAPWDHSPLRS